MSDPDALLERLASARRSLESLAAQPAPAGLTAPDEPSGERWEWGQVWAHLAEFPSYWVARIHEALASADPEPAFGRTKADAGRIAAIERDRSLPASELLARVGPNLDEAAELIEGMTDDGWARRVRHCTLGVMDMRRVFDEFLVGHLEGHVAQLQGLVPEAGSA